MISENINFLKLNSENKTELIEDLAYEKLNLYSTISTYETDNLDKTLLKLFESVLHIPTYQDIIKYDIDQVKPLSKLMNADKNLLNDYVNQILSIDFREKFVFSQKNLLIICNILIFTFGELKKYKVYTLPDIQNKIKTINFSNYNFLKDYLNEDYCEFVNDASASSFGWNFQSNAGIFLFLKYIKEAESIKIESKLQDIEINLSDGGKILAQAKSSQDYTVATDKKEKFKDAIISLAKFSSFGDQLIYISNIPDTLDSGKNNFDNKIVPYSSCLQGIRDEIDQLFESTCNSIRSKISKAKDAKKALKTEQILKLVEGFDKTKLYISVITPFGETIKTGIPKSRMPSFLFW